MVWPVDDARVFVGWLSPPLLLSRSHIVRAKMEMDDYMFFEEAIAAGVMDDLVAQLAVLDVAERARLERRPFRAATERARRGAARPLRPVARSPVARQIHVLVDNSNVFGGAQQIDNGRRDHSVRVDIARLARLLEDGRPAATRVVCGSVPSGGGSSEGLSSLWECWRSAGYHVRVAPRDAGNREVFVDEALHSELGRILTLLNDSSTRPSHHTVVLTTGDGNDNGGRTSFPAMAERLARDGFVVEIACWRQSCSRAYERLSRSGLVRLRYLDEHRENITFRRDPVAPWPRPQSRPGRETVIVRDDNDDDDDDENSLDRDVCVICISAPPLRSFSCGHVIVCPDCWRLIDHCPYCACELLTEE